MSAFGIGPGLIVIAVALIYFSQILSAMARTTGQGLERRMRVAQWAGAVNLLGILTAIAAGVALILKALS